VLIACSTSVTVYKSKHPRDSIIYDAWIKYNKETINPDCLHDYIRGTIMDTHSVPLSSVEIKVDGNNAFTDHNGKFYLIIPDGFNVNKRVTFEYPGFRNIQIPTKEVSCRELVVRMQESVRAK
jgi:hypothetical protein